MYNSDPYESTGWDLQTCAHAIAMCLDMHKSFDYEEKAIAGCEATLNQPDPNPDAFLGSSS